MSILQMLAPRSLARLLTLAALTCAAGSTLAGKPTTIYYHTDASTRPEVLVESKGAWGKSPREMKRVANRPGWWRATISGGASSLVFHHPENDEWVHPHDGQNFVNAQGAGEVFVRDHRLTYAHPDHASVQYLAAPWIDGKQRALTVILPPGYDPSSSRRYPVTYLFDGQNLVDHPSHAGGWGASDTLTQLVQSGEVESKIIVGIHAPIDGEERKYEYSPTFDEQRHFGGGAGRVVQHVADEIVPFIDAKYRTRRDSRHRAIGGSSLGAVAATHALLTQRSVFKKALLFSPAAWIANKQILRDVEAAASLRGTRVVLYHGGAGDDFDDGDNAKLLYDALAKKGLVEGKSLLYLHNPTGRHDEPTWRGVLPFGLRFLFPAR